jgi:hypothetical protein
VNGTATPLARTSEQLQRLLEDVALGRGGAASRAALPVLAWDGHSAESLAEAWDDFRDAVRAREALATGSRVWQEFYDPSECSSHDHAIELKSAEVDDAFRYLAYGPRGGAK